MIDINRINDFIGVDVFGSDDDKIGLVGQVYLDDKMYEVIWVIIKIGLFGMFEMFVFFQDVLFDGDWVWVVYLKDMVKDVFWIFSDGFIICEEEVVFYYYYGNGIFELVVLLYDQDVDCEVDGYDMFGVNIDDVMICFEEQLYVGMEKVEIGCVCLCKYIVIEQVIKIVLVSYEEIIVICEFIIDVNFGDVMSGGEFILEEYEVVFIGE